MDSIVVGIRFSSRDDAAKVRLQIALLCALKSERTGRKTNSEEVLKEIIAKAIGAAQLEAA